MFNKVIFTKIAFFANDEQRSKNIWDMDILIA
jgi:hypothetical protein